MNIEVKDLKRGQIVWECERGINVELRITRGPKRIEKSDKSAEGWEACARTTRSNAPVKLFAGDGYSAYAPRLYTEPAYA